jgi:hypothetical protein
MTRILEHVVIGTHGKLKSWLSKRMLIPRTIKVLVYDEADEMLKVGPWRFGIGTVLASFNPWYFNFIVLYRGSKIIAFGFRGCFLGLKFEFPSRIGVATRVSITFPEAGAGIYSVLVVLIGFLLEYLSVFIITNKYLS